MLRSFPKKNTVKGELRFKGDKSISHRAPILAAMAEGESVIYNLSDGEDVRSTISCLRQLGTEITEEKEKCIVKGNGFKGFRKPEKPLYAGNSGTTARLLAGVLAAQDFSVWIKGDESLSARPMNRITDPLRLMGGRIKSSMGFLPVKIMPAQNLHGINYRMKIASAQVKSAIILASLHCEDETAITETAVSRNHTELMLQLPAAEEEGCRIITSSKKYYPAPGEYYIPGDISSAAFFIVLALLAENSELLIRDVLLNETRTGFLTILKEMGANIKEENIRTAGGEKYGDLVIKGSSLKNVNIPPEVIPNIIDEVPVLTVAGIFAEGKFEIQNAAELRYKESNRLSGITENLSLTELKIKYYNDGFSIAGSAGDNMPVFDSFGDHRIAMAFMILSSVLPAGGTVSGYDCFKISNPMFLNQLKSI